MNIVKSVLGFIPSDKVNDIINTIEGRGCKYHHTALKRGYHTTKGVTVKSYCGQFGEGYTVEHHNHKSTNYYCISYYIYTPTVRDEITNGGY